MKKARRACRAFRLSREGELLLLDGRLVRARLRIALVLLRRRLRGCGLDLGGAGRDGLLVFVAHVMNPFMKRRPKNIFRYLINMGSKRQRTR